MMTSLDFLLKIGCAFITGTLIGVERQFKQRNAGLRTNALVSVGSAAFILVSSALTVTDGDPARIAAQIVSGVGFLGGGLILKDGLNVRGLNSAATIWCSAACGTLSGVGLYLEAFILVAVVIFAHTMLTWLSKGITKITTHKYSYILNAVCRVESSEKVRQTIINTLSFDKEVQLNSLYYKTLNEQSVTVYCEFETEGEHIALLDLIISRLKANYGVIDAGWDNRTNYVESV